MIYVIASVDFIYFFAVALLICICNTNKRFPTPQVNYIYDYLMHYLLGLLLLIRSFQSCQAFLSLPSIIFIIFFRMFRLAVLILTIDNIVNISFGQFLSSLLTIMLCVFIFLVCWILWVVILVFCLCNSRTTFKVDLCVVVVGVYRVDGEYMYGVCERCLITWSYLCNTCLLFHIGWIHLRHADGYSYLVAITNLVKWLYYIRTKKKVYGIYKLGNNYAFALCLRIMTQ